MVSNHLFSNSEVLMGTFDVSINAKVGDWVVNIVTSSLLLVLVLITAGGRADGVRFGLNESPWLELVTFSVFDLLDATFGVSHVLIKFRSIVVESLLSWIFPLSLGLFSTHD